MTAAYCDRVASPLGLLVLLTDAQGRLLSVQWEADQPIAAASIGGLHGAGSRFGHPAAFKAYFDGDIAALDRLPVAPMGTPFQQRVWAALRRIPAGSAISYGALAAWIGQPGAARAVGQANGRNPVPLVIPCHRVIASTGRLGGYSSGLDRKRWLLAHEGVALDSPAALAAAA